jgi:hypothetical protein
MKLISHRGNIDGINIDTENNPSQIDKVINIGYDVEIDLRFKDNKLFLGHDYLQYEIDIEWLNKRKDKLWVHAKDYDSVTFLKNTNLNWFWHDKDDMTLTSHGFIWSNIGKYFEGGITVSLEYIELPDYILGVCTDELNKFIK